MTTPLTEALDRLVPNCDREFGDWQEVLTASGISRSTVIRSAGAAKVPRRPRRRQLIGLTLIAVAIVLFATPAFGLRELIVDFVTGRTAISFNKSRPAPAVVKQRFAELPIGAPPGMSPSVLAGQARQITFRTPLGHKRVIWVAPTHGGGFCSIGTANGGCISKTTEKRLGPVSITEQVMSRTGKWRMIEVGGYVFSPKVATLTLEFADHQSMQLPFVFISEPIDAGFFYYGLPPNHQQAGHWPTELIARDSHGSTVGIAKVRTPNTRALPPRLPPQAFKPQPPRSLPAASTVNPTAPLQTGSTNGVTVTAGANGAIRFGATNLPMPVRRLLRGNVSFSCFRLTREFGLLTVRGDGDYGAFADSVGMTLRGVGRPLDGCEVDGSGGHRWPDALGSHSAVEIAFTPKGRAYFADRAAARDLALFVRSAHMQQIRKEPSQQLLHDMEAAYGSALARSRIRYQLTANGITFTETSTTGKQFRVVVDHGRVAHSNVEPYAKVF